MSRLEALVQQHPITIETQKFRLPPGESAIAIPFTLRFQGQSLSEKIHTEETITVVQALTTLFTLADAARTDPHFRRMSAKMKKALQQLLGPLYEQFWQAFSQDEQEALERQQAMTRASFAAAVQAAQQVFQPGERVKYLGDGGGLREEDWIYCTVIDEVWRWGSFQGYLVRREKDGIEITKPPVSLRRA